MDESIRRRRREGILKGERVGIRFRFTFEVSLHLWKGLWWGVGEL